MKRKTYSDEQFRAAVAASGSVAGVLRAIGLVPAGGNYRTVQEGVRALGLDTSHWVGQAWCRGKTQQNGVRYQLSDLLVENSAYRGTATLKSRLVRAGLLANACSSCGISEWNGKPLALELDHINGHPSDHRLENLRLLCPNCHSQTDTFRGRGIARRPPRRSS